MKKVFLTLLTIAASLNMMAMSMSKMRQHARFITDRMAYELNLSAGQYEDCYEINFDFIYAVEDILDDVARGYSDAIDRYYTYLDYRNEDLYNVLTDAQYDLFQLKEYFYRPIYASSSRWYFRIYTIYDNVHFFYRQPPICFRTYRGAHCRRYYTAGYYVGRHHVAPRPPYRGHIRGGMHFDSYRGHDFGPNIRHRGGRVVHSGHGNDVYYRPGGGHRDNVRPHANGHRDNVRPQANSRPDNVRPQGAQRHEGARPEGSNRHQTARPQSQQRTERPQSQQRTERTQPQRTERPQSHPRTESQQPQQRTERPQSQQRTERTQPQRTERPQSQQRTERQQPQQRTERTMPQRTERTMPQRTERQQPQQRTERTMPQRSQPAQTSPQQRSGGGGGGVMRGGRR